MVPRARLHPLRLDPLPLPGKPRHGLHHPDQGRPWPARTVGMSPSGAGRGHVSSIIGFTNGSDHPCSLSGYPGVAGMNSAGRQMSQALRSPGGYLAGSYTVSVVVLAPGGRASALVEGTDVRMGSATSCPDNARLLVDAPSQTRSPWPASDVNNNAVIDGVVARYEAAGIRAGIYSYGKAWKAVTAGRVLPGLASWPPGLLGACRSQGTGCGQSHVRSGELRREQALADPVDRRRARRQPHLPGSHRASRAGQPPQAVPERQPVHRFTRRRCRRAAAPSGGSHRDGAFGATTRARVVAFQRARHLTANGVVGSAVWRALGAGSGTYIPAVRGFMDALFAPT